MRTRRGACLWNASVGSRISTTTRRRWRRPSGGSNVQALRSTHWQRAQRRSSALSRAARPTRPSSRRRRETPAAAHWTCRSRSMTRASSTRNSAPDSGAPSAFSSARGSRAQNVRNTRALARSRRHRGARMCAHNSLRPAALTQGLARRRCTRTRSVRRPRWSRCSQVSTARPEAYLPSTRA